MGFLIRGLLVGLTATGLWSAGQLSLQQFQTGEACPVLGNAIPACYIALFAYILIALGVALLFASPSHRTSYLSQSLFWSGMVIAAGLASIASIMELISGDICPVAFGDIPMCYISLAFNVVIAWLYLAGGKQEKQLSEEETG